MAVCKVSFALPISDEMFEAIEERDENTDCYPSKYFEYNILAGILERRTGVSNVDYNGHFGAFIYFDVTSDDNTESMLYLVTDIINSWAAGEDMEKYV